MPNEGWRCGAVPRDDRAERCDRLGAGASRSRTSPRRAPRPAGPPGRTRPGRTLDRRSRAQHTARRAVRQRRLGELPRCSRCTPRTRVGLLYRITRPWPSSTSTSAPPRSRRSASPSSTRSTCATPTARRSPTRASRGDRARRPACHRVGLRSRAGAAGSVGRRGSAAVVRDRPAALERGAGRHRPHRPRVHREPVRAGAVRGGARGRGRHPPRRRQSTSTVRRSSTSG